MIKLAISGCQGRMGRRIASLAFADADVAVHSLLERPDHPQCQERINHMTIATDPEGIKGSEVLIEFTTPEATMQHLEFCIAHHIPMVIGTTGLTPEHNNRIRTAAQKIAIVYSANMSVGVNILFKLVEVLAQKTPASYTVNIREAHHIHKKDQPSGTAKALARIIEENSSHHVEDIAAIREGEIVGDHRVTFTSPDDSITIEHHAKTRDIFARGALVAAKFITKKHNGLFTMQDVLGLK